MANDEILRLIQEINAQKSQNANSESLSFGEKAKGYTQSALAGITYNFADEAESAIASLFNKIANPSIPYSDLYSQNLNTIRTEQERFKEKTPYLDNAVEIGASFINPLSLAGKALKATNAAAKGIRGAKTAGRALEWAPIQAAISGVGSAEGNENIIRDAITSAAIGSSASAVGSSTGQVLKDTGLQANRLKLSAYGVSLGDIKHETKKLGDDIADVIDDLPIVKSINRFERTGIIDAGNDVIDNFKNVLEAQKGINKELQNVLEKADQKLAPFPSFQTDITENYISGLTGKARENAKAAALDEITALQSQIGTGTLADLQRLKVGLNYKWDQNPYAEDVLKAIRSDIRQEIENRIDNAAKRGVTLTDSSGKDLNDYTGIVKSLNKEWGNLADVKSTFAQGVAKKYGGNVVEDIFGQLRTSGGAGTLNIMTAQTGNLIPMAAGGLLNAARAKPAQSAIADVARDFRVPLEVTGYVLPELVTGRSVSQAVGDGEAIKKALESKPRENKETPQIDKSVTDLIQEIQKLRGVKNNATEIEVKGLPKSSLAEDLFSKKQPEVKKKDISAIEQEIDQNPYYSALYEVESGRNPKAKNPKSTAKGAFQFIDDTAKRVGLKDSYDLGQSFEAVQKLTEPHAKEFGEDPRTLYAAHFLGATLLRKVLNDKPLKPEEEKNVRELINVALPRFERIYQNKVA